MRKLKHKSDEVTRNLAEKDPDAKKLLENILKYREMFMFWSDYSEKSFLSQDYSFDGSQVIKNGNWKRINNKNNWMTINGITPR